MKSERLTNIRETMKQIAIKYKLRDNGLHFNSIVITHRDQDHYRGILELMRTDCDVATGIIPFLYYSDDGTPTSTLYMPYERILVKEPQYINVGRSRVLRFPIDGVWHNVIKVVADLPRENIGSLNGAPMQLKRVDRHQVVGRELFSGELTDFAQVATSPAKLIEAYKASKGAYQGDRPGLFCVAANNRYLPCDIVSAHNPHSYTNRSSIVCLVIRPPVDKIPRTAVSHYMAGDAESDLEAGVVKWIGLEAALPDGPKLELYDTVPIVKASHHGLQRLSRLPCVRHSSQGSLYSQQAVNSIILVRVRF